MCVIVKVEKVKRNYVTCDANTTLSEVAQECTVRVLNQPGLPNDGDGDGGPAQGGLGGLHDDLFSVPRLDHSNHVICEKSSNMCRVFVSISRSHYALISTAVMT